MDGRAGHAGSLEVSLKLIAHPLRRAEDDRFGVLVVPIAHTRLRQHLQQELVLVVHGAGRHNLANVLVALQLVTVADLNLDRIAEEFSSQPTDGHGPGRCEEHGVPVGTGDPLQDLSDLRLEAHVQHPIGFVQHELAHVSQLQLVAFEEIIDTPRRSDDSMDAVPQRPSLRAFGSTAIAASGSQAARSAKLHRFFLNLDSKFSRRSHDQQLRASGANLALNQVVEGGQQEAKGLTAAGCSDADDV
mmetsp:Transcript_54423/g.126940  ORF Transcript_54423/g.126940 Transcript_54423/m.126940 type:complete len:245 (+) Transcript_54423:506-1240(+)